MSLLYNTLRVDGSNGINMQDEGIVFLHLLKVKILSGLLVSAQFLIIGAIKNDMLIGS